VALAACIDACPTQAIVAPYVVDEVNVFRILQLN
jgi:epoxyqueuosine reductase QueG